MSSLRAPAKLNLYLRVLGRRPDGYHHIETLFERIDLADELTFAPARELTLTCDEPTLSCGDDNLVLKAARRLRQYVGVTAGARIHLAKRIPVAAGLGGGSSDAASTLMGLNVLWRVGLTQAQLVALAAQLGSDVPVFFLEAPFAIGRGRGERCENVSGCPRLNHVLVVPPAALSTADVYASARFDLTPSEPSISMVVHALRNGSQSELAEGLINSLEPEAIRRCPLICHIKLSLKELGCFGTLVSGSGPAVFGLCRDSAHAQDVVRDLPDRLGAALGVGNPAWKIQIVQTDSSRPPLAVSGS